MLLKNIVLPHTRERLLELIDVLKKRAAVEGVILAGTKLRLVLIEESASNIPLLDTVKSHVLAAAVTRLWSQSAFIQAAGDQ